MNEKLLLKAISAEIREVAQDYADSYNDSEDRDSVISQVEGAMCDALRRIAGRLDSLSETAS